MGCIYLITNLVNGKQYVGKTILDVWQRWELHVGAARRRCNNMLLHRAIRKYGREHFTVVILEEADDDAYLLQREVWWIDNLDTQKHGYNLTSGGEGLAGHTPSMSTRQKLRTANLGRTWNDNQRRAHVGIPRSEETKQKLSESHKGILKGRKLTDEVKQNMSKAQKQVRSEKKRQHLLEMNAAKRGTTLSDEQKQKISQSLKGRPKSAEWKQKMSELQKGKPQPWQKGRKQSAETQEKKRQTRLRNKALKEADEQFID